MEINGGKFRINGGQSQSRGDGIDCNGILIINGGEIISAGYKMDSGLDGSAGIIINGGIAIGAGSPIDTADEGCLQPSMNLIFNSNVGPNQVLTIEDSKGNVIVKFSPAGAGFIEGSVLHTYNTLIVSHPKFETFKIYKVFLDGKLVGYNPNGGRRSFWGGGNQGPGGQPWWGGNSKDSGSNKDKKGDNYYKVNENNANEKGEEDNDDSSEEDEEVEYRSIFMLTKNVETFSGVTQV